MKEPSPDARARIHDEALALAASRGDQRAFRALYERQHRCVATYVTKLVGAGPDRDDVVQEVFLQLHRALPGFRGDAGLSTFLRRITMNVVFDHLRRRGRSQRMAHDSDALDAVPDASQDPERHASARQELQALLHDLGGLALEKGRALLLVAVAGWSLHDAAAQMGTSASRVKQRVRRARRELTRMAKRGPSSRRSRSTPRHGRPDAIGRRRPRSRPVIAACDRGP
jgi:RNA polymerase sigma-70 factor (ECF subfamily)